MKNIVLLGPPGVGKGSQAARLSRRFGVLHVSTGDLLRQEITKHTILGMEIQAALARGEFASDQIVNGLIRTWLSRPELRRGFILDGFPRSVPQAERLEQLLSGQRRRVDFALLLKAPEGILRARLGGRQVCPLCRASYHCRFRAPRRARRCDDCGTELVVRDDDASSSYQTRHTAYERITRPLVDYYRHRGVLLEVNAADDLESVARRVETALLRASEAKLGVAEAF